MTPESPQTPQPLAPVRRSEGWKSWVLALLIFIGGTAFGVGATVIVELRAVQRAIQHPERAPARIAARISRRLGLDARQRDQVERIVARRQQSLAEIRRTVQPRVETELNQLETEVSQVLTPPQRRRWEGMLGSFRETWIPPLPEGSSDAGSD
jgi:hypothetical protein